MLLCFNSAGLYVSLYITRLLMLVWACMSLFGWFRFSVSGCCVCCVVLVMLFWWFVLIVFVLV